jgi:hypothetical protein
MKGDGYEVAGLDPLECPKSHEDHPLSNPLHYAEC